MEISWCWWSWTGELAGFRLWGRWGRWDAKGVRYHRVFGGWLFFWYFFGPICCIVCMGLYRKIMKTNGGKIGYWKGRQQIWYFNFWFQPSLWSSMSLPHLRKFMNEIGIILLVFNGLFGCYILSRTPCPFWKRDKQPVIMMLWVSPSITERDLQTWQTHLTSAFAAR